MVKTCLIKVKVTLNSLVFPWAVECFLSFGFLPRSRNLFIYFFKYVRVVQEILVVIHVEVLHSISKKVLSFIHHPPQKNVKNLNVQKFQTPLGKTQKQKTTHKKGKKENMHRSLPALENHHLSAYKKCKPQSCIHVWERWESFPSSTNFASPDNWS